MNLRPLFGRVLQLLAIAGMAAIALIIAHKGQGDIGALRAAYSGAEFWFELARYFLRNLAS